MSPMTESADARRLRVLTVNIHKGWTAWRGRYMLTELREAIRAVASDLVLLQEVHGPRDGLEGAQAEYLADMLWRDHAWARNAIVRGGSHGNAVLSRWPILHHMNHDVSLPGDEPRGLLHCVLGLPGMDLHAICVHLGLREPHRIKQMGLLSKLVNTEIDSREPVVVAGDFNDWRRRAHGILARDAGFQEVFVQADGHSAKTFPARYPLLQLDRIYVRNTKAHSPLILPRRPWSHLSDHAPLAAEIAL